jgi:hypothetical protein
VLWSCLHCLLENGLLGQHRALYQSFAVCSYVRHDSTLPKAISCNEEVHFTELIACLPEFSLAMLSS